ncbi:phage major capsid protein [Rhodoplanes sp. TEM]|uniref:Phage major capsid protein n=1 Tax=Rhodoplanes tepidamans TaxID=200616 RepID=A0ABT5JDJ3_RHOTP|nr:MULTISPECIES: phage major capsid protein [Rhodoplanes]MDC7787583.1 phage major capsid protein [Rhodoplanes tepidamans]MDC7984924.1 phage major capsid protein [Rhodoplanes sp. TEM]MDQ0358011.1 HK97 family phage major capsid protein [Rhodoplanes tepidamans]
MDIDIDRLPADRGPVASPETKAGPEARLTLDDFMRTFEAYKQVNDARLGQIERRGAADPLTEDRLARIDATLIEHQRRVDELALKGARPAFGRDAADEPAGREHKAAFDAYVRKGDATGLLAVERKALSVGAAPDGGYLVPPEVEHEIGRRLADVSPIRAIAGSRTVSASVYKKPFMTAGPTVGWIGETEARPQTATPALAELSFPTMELYAMPAATATLLDDAMVDIEAWLASEVDQAFAEQEGAAFVSGDGVNKPKGFLAYPTVANAAWSWGSIGVVASGAAGAFPASHPADVLIDLADALRAGYRRNAVFVMNRRTESTVRKFKDSTGQYLWSPGLAAGQPATLLGHPVVVDDAMPDIAAGALAIAFGDFRRGYLVVDRAGVRVLRDPYSAKPYVLFYTTKRVGGGVQDFDAIKLLKFAAS